MTARSDGARRDKVKRLAESIARLETRDEAGVDVRSLPDLLHALFPCGDVTDLDAPPCWTAAQAVLASDWLAADRAAQRAEALREAAAAWQIGGWSNVLLPKPTPPAVPVIAYSNRVLGWLRDRAAHIESEAGL